MAMYQHLVKNGPGYLWLLAGAGSSLAYIYPHTEGLEGFIDETVSCTSGVPDKVNKDFLISAEVVKHNLDWDRFGQWTGTLLKFIPSRLLEFSHQGSMASKWGGVIAVPKWFGAEPGCREEIVSDILSQSGVDITTDKGKHIINSFKLSADAERFILAREMTETKSPQIFINTGVVGFTFPLTYFLGMTTAQFLPFPGGKLMSFCMCAPLLGLACLRGVDFMNCWAQSRADAKVARLSERTAQGGLEYYDSVILRNELMDTDKWERETVTQQKKSFLSYVQDIRKPSYSNVERRQHLVNIKDKLYNTRNTETEKDAV